MQVEIDEVYNDVVFFAVRLSTFNYRPKISIRIYKNQLVSYLGFLM